MKKSNWGIVFLLLITFGMIDFSCTERSYLKSKDASVIPYKGDEVLIFKNTNGAFDSIYLDGYKYEFVDYSKENCRAQRYILKYNARKRYNIEDLHDLMSYYVYLESNCTGRYLILSSFWNQPVFIKGKSIDSLKISETISLETGEGYLRDVLLFQTEKSEQEMSDSSIVRMYWSKRDGVVGYDFKNQISWRLHDIIRK